MWLSEGEYIFIGYYNDPIPNPNLIIQPQPPHLRKAQQLQIIPMNFNTKARKRVSFTPIMLTSKSIRPVDRPDYELMRNERKLSGAKQSRDELSSYIFKLSNDFSNGTTCGFAFPREDAENQRGSGSEEGEEDGYKKLIRKMTTPTVVRVQFQEELNKSRRRVEKKIKESVEGESETTPLEKNRYVYSTNAKTFEQIIRMAKIHPHKRNLHIMKEEADEEFLDSYYLSIRKVKPFLKKDSELDEADIRKKISSNSEKQNHPHVKNSESSQIMKIKRKDHLRTHSKRQDRHQQHTGSPQKDNSDEGLEDPIKLSVYKKIEQDISTRRTNSRQKDFFVFGMSQTTGKIAEATLKNRFDTYRDFIFRVNFTNGLYVKPREEGDRPLKCFVGFGNNSALIKGILRRRFWWEIVDKVTDDTHFVWTQLKIAEVFKKQARSICKFRINRFNRHPQQKEGETQEESIFEMSSPLQASSNLMCGEDLRIWKKYASKYEKAEERGYDYYLGKRVGGLLKKKGVTFLENNSKLHVHNHLQCNYFLGNKKALFYSLRKYYQLLKEDPFTKIPLTFHITQGIQDPQFQLFLLEFESQNEKRKVDKQFRNIWIIKPGELTNRGRGITVCSTLDEIKNRLKSKQRNFNGTSRTFILQKYIEKPLLYQRRKFDIRHYMAITCHNGKMKGYWYAQGYIRTTSAQYSTKNTKDLFTHLTNDAVQKNGQDYGKFEKGNKISYAEFQKYLTANIPAKVEFQKQILPKMKALAIDSIRSTYAMLDPERKQHNFELFGLDFMLDESLNVYLIEVNTNPCLETSCPLLTKIITPLVENVFKLCLDPLFPPPYQWPNQKKYNLGENALEENKFTLVFDEAEDGPQLKELYRNTVKIDGRMGDIYEEDEQYQDQEKEWNDQEELCQKKAQ